MIALLDPDVEMHDSLHNTALHGRDAVERIWRQRLALAEYVVVPLEVIDVGDTVVLITHSLRYERDGGPVGDGVSTANYPVYCLEQVGPGQGRSERLRGDPALVTLT